MFDMPRYQAPDFAVPALQNAPDVRLAPAPMDAVAPDDYHATSIYPEYFKIGGRWVLAEESRMDCVAVVDEGKIAVREFRTLKAGELVVLGRGERGEEGVYVHMDGFVSSANGGSDGFAFRKGRSRETSYSRDYDALYELLRHERDHGNVLWVLGPACSFDSDARDAMAGLIERGYVSALQAGNALATHDLEGGLFKTALGQDIYTQALVPNGHYHHIDVINKVRACGSIPAFVEQYGIKDGIMAACVKMGVPFVLTGSIRDDGPLPEVYADVYQGQDATRALIRRATTVICLATQLHTIAVGNMTPAFRVVDGVVRPLFIHTVDISEFAVNKLRDRGSLSVTSFIANAQDFLVNVSRGLQRIGGQRFTSPPPGYMTRKGVNPMKKVKVCEKCSGLDVKALKKDVKALGGEVKIDCFGECNKKHPEYAGKVHGKIDGEHVVCATEAEFRAKIKEALGK